MLGLQQPAGFELLQNQGVVTSRSILPKTTKLRQWISGVATLLLDR